MTVQKILATGVVDALVLNGKSADTQAIVFENDGPFGDKHRGFTRKLSSHDGEYIRTSVLLRGRTVFNWRSWTGVSAEEIEHVEEILGCALPCGILLENIVFKGIPQFSKLAVGSRIVFPPKETDTGLTQAILAVWEENGPCATVAARLADVYPEKHNIKRDFIRAAQHKRGVMGFVLSPGSVSVGDVATVYPPVQ